MKEALRLAARGEGRTSPNPLVGAVVVQGDVVVGRGFHEVVGGPHAEVNALRDAGAGAKGAELFVTLEPCNHHGRTPPCTEAVLKAGVSSVVIGMKDPNPDVKGGGADFLRARGIAVEAGILERECRLLNQPFIKYAGAGLPFVVLKAAATLDGRIATRTGDSKWISNEKSRRFAHRLRSNVDAILVGIGTVLADDPLLTARRPGKSDCRQPIRIVADAGLRLPVSSRLVQTAREIPVWAACAEDAPPDRELRLRDLGVDVLRLPAKEGRVNLERLLKELGNRRVTSLLVEGGAQIHGQFLEKRLADAFYFFYAPKILGDPEALPIVSGGKREAMSEALNAYDIGVKRFGWDIMLSGRFREEIY